MDDTQAGFEEFEEITTERPELINADAFVATIPLKKLRQGRRPGGNTKVGRVRAICDACLYGQHDTCAGSCKCIHHAIYF